MEHYSNIYTAYVVILFTASYYLIFIKNAMFNFHNKRHIMFEKHLLKHSHGYLHFYIHFEHIHTYIYVIIGVTRLEILNKLINPSLIIIQHLKI